MGELIKSYFLEVMAMDEWINDGIWYCGQCDIDFKVSVRDDEPMVSFCPCCGSRELEPKDDDNDLDMDSELLNEILTEIEDSVD
jgi:hypothetical protein